MRNEARRARIEKAIAAGKKINGEVTAEGVADALMSATQVRITDEIWMTTGLPEAAARAVLTAGFRAAGFEVIE